MSWFVPPFYWSTVYALRFILTLLARWKATGREHIPDGPLIVVSNHLNNADPPILAAGIARRRLRFMAKIELFKLPFGIIPRMWGAFPVRRFEADMGALLAAERILREGGAIGMFPEGTRSRTGYLGKPHPGTALIALRSGATILPCAITGTERFRDPFLVFKRPRITVTVGEPFAVERIRRPAEEQVNILTARIMDEIRRLLPEQYVGPAYTEEEASHHT